MATMSLAQARKAAKSAGIPAAVIRGKTAAQLQFFLNGDGNGDQPRPRKKTAVKAAVSAPARRGRPKGSTSKSRASKSVPAVKSTRGEAKRPTTASADGEQGRNTLGMIDYTKTEGWNPREGSAPDRIIKALKKAKGNRERAFDILLPNLWDFVGKKMQDGTKRTKGNAEAMLKYRIARTEWDFALHTGQHEKSSNRVNAGGNGASTKTAAKAATVKRGRPRKQADETPVKRGPGRPRKTAQAEPVVKRGPGRPRKQAAAAAAPAKRGPGRPRGSKTSQAAKTRARVAKRTRGAR